MDAAPPHKTKEDNMVSKLLQIIQNDLPEVKEVKTVKEEKLENIVTNIGKKLIAENNKALIRRDGKKDARP